MDFPTGKFQIVYADPPWSFKNYNNKTSNSNADHHYPCMNMEDIKKLPVKDLADKDCVLFMWCTDPLLNKQLEVIDSWGFNFKTVGFYWIKENKNQTKTRFWKGTGYWTRANPEICVLATIGKPKRINFNVDKLVFATRDIHSRKPQIFKDLIVKLCGDIPRIELFARFKSDGWKAWGDQLSG